MINIIITSYNEPLSTEKAINAFLRQDIPKPFKITIADPFEEVQSFIEKKFKNNKEVEFFLDEGLGKGYVLNSLFRNIYSSNKKDIIVLTDGDVFVENNVINEILEAFKDENIGVISGHPIPLDKRDNKYGFWANLQFDAINQIRKKLSKKGFFEASGYLFAIRNGVIKGFPEDSSEDSIIPFLFYEKGYKIKYLENAKVYVKNPSNWKDWLNQRKRNIKGHYTLRKNTKNTKVPQTKTLANEIKRGVIFSLTYPKNLKEYFWTIQFYFARWIAWISAYYEIKFSKKRYEDGWRETEIKSTRILD